MPSRCPPLSASEPAAPLRRIPPQTRACAARYAEDRAAVEERSTVVEGVMDYDTASGYYGELVSGYLPATAAATVDDTVARFTAPVCAAFEREQAAEQTIAGILWAAWEPVILAAGASSGTAQDRLVDLLTGVKGQGVLTRGQGRQECVIWGGLRVFADLPCFGAQMREAWDIGVDAPGSPDSWVNMNAFAARLTAAGIDFSPYAIWTLRDCLEEGSSVSPGDLRAAAAWFQHSGALLCSLARQPGSPGDGDRAPGRLGRLCASSGMSGGGFTTERWQFWRSRLTELAAGTDAAAPEARAA